MSQNICEFCKSELSSKYSLKNHLLKNKNCLALRNLQLKTNFICKSCSNYFTDIHKLSTHYQTCKLYIEEKYNDEINIMKDNHSNYIKQINILKEQIEENKKENEEIKNNYEKEINILKEQIEENKKENAEIKNNYEKEIKDNHEKEIKEIKDIHEKEINIIKEYTKKIETQHDKMFSSFEKLATQTKQTTNVTNNNNIYSDKFFLENLSQEDIKRKCQNYLTEQVFMGGQRGIAQMCSEHIIKTPDNRVLLKCVDTSRKKFKYIDENGNMKEDHEARTFTEKVFEPIKQMSTLVYENILSDIKDEQDQLEQTEYSRKSLLHDKTFKAIDCFAKIINIDNPNENTEFKNELAILNK